MGEQTSLCFMCPRTVMSPVLLSPRPTDTSSCQSTETEMKDKTTQPTAQSYDFNVMIPRALPPYSVSHFIRVRLFATLWTVALQAPLSMEFSRQEYWSGLPCPPGDLPDPGIVSCISCIGRQVLYHEHHLGSPGVPSRSPSSPHFQRKRG